MRKMRTLSLVSGFVLAAVASVNAFATGGGAPEKPTESASKVRITYTADASPTSLIPIRLLEGIEIWPAKDETNITHYNVYWGDVAKNKLGIDLAPRLAHIPANGSGEKLVYEFPPNLKMEAGAIYVLVCTENQGVEFCGHENNMEKVTDPLLKMFGTISELKKIVKDNENLPGVKAMAKCGDLVCDGGVETAQSCPSDCSDYLYSSFNLQVLCDEAQRKRHPRSIADVQQAIRDAKALGMRVKVSSGQGNKTTSGSATTLVCSDGMILVMDQFDHHQPGLEMKLEVFEGVETVNVASGTNLHELGEWLYERGLGLGYVHLGWRHVSVAGAIGTSAHGSSPKHRDVVAHSVVSMDVVNPDGELKTYSRGTTGQTDPDLWAALKTHLGYLGVITRVRIETKKATRTQVKVTFHEEEELFEKNTKGSVFADIAECDYGQYNWFPSLNQYLRTCGKTTTAPSEEGANNELLFPYINLEQFSAQQTMQVFQAGAADVTTGAHEKMAFMRRAGWHLTPPLTKVIDGKKRYNTNAVGPTHRMTSSKLINTIGREMFQMDWEVAVPAKHLQGAMEYIRDFTNGLNAKNRDVPVPLIGIFVRFSKSESGSLMAYTGTGESFEESTVSAHIEMPIYVPIDLPEATFENYVAPYEEAMRKLITEYGARAHWGKNMHSEDPWVFELQRDNGTFGDRLDRFNKQVEKMDPNGMFANKFAKSMGIKYKNFTYPASW